MVEKQVSLYLLIGQDPAAKDAQLKKIKETFLDKTNTDFNLDVFYARELNLCDFQERVLALPLKAKKRLLVIKGAQSLKENIRAFILKEVSKGLDKIVLVLDVDQPEAHDTFVQRIARFARVYRFGVTTPLDTFTLSRSIESGKAEAALRILAQLLAKGERPERIMGGLRYSWVRQTSLAVDNKRKLRLLLNCDVEIKTGRLTPRLALEKLVIALCNPMRT